jgi:transposase-like protein
MPSAGSSHSAPLPTGTRPVPVGPPKTTNAGDSLNAGFRSGVRHRTHFPNEQAALKVLYLVAFQQKAGRSNRSGR